MRFFELVFGIFAVLLGAFAADNGLQTVVEWDNGSLQISGERVIIMSGEFHYARLPVPEVSESTVSSVHLSSRGIVVARHLPEV